MKRSVDMRQYAQGVMVRGRSGNTLPLMGIRLRIPTVLFKYVCVGVLRIVGISTHVTLWKLRQKRE